MFGETVKLADFGWSSHNENMRNTYCGTPDYLAPEMISRSTHNEKLDIWSVGVLAFEMLTGFAPFTPPNVKERGQKMKALEHNISVEVVDRRGPSLIYPSMCPQRLPCSSDRPWLLIRLRDPLQAICSSTPGLSNSG